MPRTAGVSSSSQVRFISCSGPRRFQRLARWMARARLGSTNRSSASYDDGFKPWSLFPHASTASGSRLVVPEDGISAAFAPRRWATFAGQGFPFRAVDGGADRVGRGSATLRLWPRRSWTPSISKTARIGPPAMMPVPGTAVRMIALPAPHGGPRRYRGAACVASTRISRPLVACTQSPCGSPQAPLSCPCRRPTAAGRRQR